MTFKVATSIRGTLSAFQGTSLLLLVRLLSPSNIFTDVIVTFSMPLVRMIPTFQKMFNLMSAEEFCFLYTEPDKDGYGMFLSVPLCDTF